MNYIEQLNLFDRWLEGNYLPAKAQLLWYKLMQLDNKLSWRRIFQLDNCRAMAMIEVHNRRDINKYRDCLKDAGIIKFEKGTKNHPSSYELLPFWVAEDGTVHTGGEREEPEEVPVEEVPDKQQLQEEPKAAEEPEEVEVIEEETPLEPVKIERTNFNEIVNFWNANCGGLPKIKDAKGSKRQNAIRARINEYSVEEVKEAIVKAGKSVFLNGGGDRGFRATFDWIMRPNNFPKVLEGNYDFLNKKQANNVGQPVTTDEFHEMMQEEFWEEKDEQSRNNEINFFDQKELSDVLLQG